VDLVYRNFSEITFSHMCSHLLHYLIPTWKTQIFHFASTLQQIGLVQIIFQPITNRTIAGLYLVNALMIFMVKINKSSECPLCSELELLSKLIYNRYTHTILFSASVFYTALHCIPLFRPVTQTFQNVPNSIAFFHLHTLPIF
jgi:hypothetical protein